MRDFSTIKRGAAAIGLTVAVLRASSAEAAFTREPWIQDATTTSVTIAWEAGTTGGAQRLVYGAGEAMDQSVDGTLVSTRLFKATVTGLTPSSRFSYKVFSSQDESPAGSFVTAPAVAEPFRFGVTGDNRSDSAGHANVVAATLPHDPDFMLNTGDIVDGTDYTGFFDVEKALLRNAVIFPSPGNHDAPAQYQYGFDRPNYYSFRWGNAFFLSINTDGDYGAGSAQLPWIEAQLAAAKADATIQWIIAYHHHPVYSSGSHGDTAEAKALLNPLYKQYGVDVVFAGHDHNYERVELDNIVYVVAGGGGVSTRAMGTPRDGQIFAESVRHVAIVDIDGGVLDLTAYRTDGTVLDARRLEKGPPSGGSEPGPGNTPEPPGGDAPADGMETVHGSGCACDLGAATHAAAPIAPILLSVGAGLIAVLRRRRTRPRK